MQMAHIEEYFLFGTQGTIKMQYFYNLKASSKSCNYHNILGKILIFY